MDVEMFTKESPGRLVAIRGGSLEEGNWTHQAFLPAPLGAAMPTLQPETFLAVANARASLAALDNTARHLPNPSLLRLPTLRREAQSTSALEGTYAPLQEVLAADEDAPATAELTEILNYVRAATHGFSWVSDGRPLTVSLLSDLQRALMQGTPLEHVSGMLRDGQVVIGHRPDADPSLPAVLNARFVPAPPGDDLTHGVRDLVDWMQHDHGQTIDPVVAAAMSHYQLETLHPFRDGNGRIGRLTIVLYLQAMGVLSEPTLTVSPWFEARRGEYYDRLLAVSTHNDWDAFVRFFARGIAQAADSTHTEMNALAAVQSELKDIVRSSHLRADSAHNVVDLAVANPTFTVRKVEAEIGISYARANKLVAQLTELGVLRVLNPHEYKRRFYSPKVFEVLTRKATGSR